MTTNGRPYARALMSFHHILSTKKKFTIRKEAKRLEIYGICKVGYPGILAVEGEEERLKRYIEKIKVTKVPPSLRWQSYKIATVTSGLSDGELSITAGQRAASVPSKIVMVKEMDEFKAHMRRVGLDDWWRKAMGYGSACRNG